MVSLYESGRVDTEEAVEMGREGTENGIKGGNRGGSADR